MTLSKATRLWFFLIAFPTLCGCELLQALKDNALLPEVAFEEATLVQAPSQEMMAAYYCPKVLSGVPALGCMFRFRSKPKESELQISFALRYTVKNPNRFPVPVAELLTAVRLFPQAARQSLGAACVVFCDPSDSNCTGRPKPTSCRSSNQDVRTVDDFANAASNLLIGTGVQAATGERPTFRTPQVSAESEIPITAIFAFGPEPMLQALEHLATRSIQQLEDGELPTFLIPFNLEGTVWMDVGSLGRASAAFGPADGSWTLPTTALVPSF